MIDFTLRGCPLFVSLRVVVSIIGRLVVEKHIADTWHAIRRRNCPVLGVPPYESDIPLLTLGTGTSWVSLLKRFIAKKIKVSTGTLPQVLSSIPHQLVFLESFLRIDFY
jgi:hypothetical protein